METLILTMDTIAFMVVIYFSYKSEKSPDKPESGPFRIRLDAPDVPPTAKGSTSLRSRSRR